MCLVVVLGREKDPTTNHKGALSPPRSLSSLPAVQELARIRDLEQNPTLRWEHAMEDSAAEAERMAAYKAARRERYAQRQEAIVANAEMTDQLDSLTLHG